MYAGFWARALAFAVDYLLVVLTCALLKGLVGLRLESAAAQQSFFWLTLLVLLLYKAAMESSPRQATLGKLAFDLRVTSRNGERIGLGRALVRNLAQVLSAVILYIGYLMAAFTQRRQALHDLIAGTLVTRRQYSPAEIAAATVNSPPAGRRSAPVRASPEPPKAASATQQAARGSEMAPQSEPLPELPLRVSFRDAWRGPGKRAVLENLSDDVLEIVLDVQSAATGAHFRRTYIINPRSFGQIGKTQGWPFAPGQLVTVSNPRYRPIVKTVT